MSAYDAAFFEYVTDESLQSAQVVMPWVITVTGAEKVVDVGCGSAAWASVAKAHGCTVRGIDNFVPDHLLLIDPNELVRADLTQGFDCSGFDLAICLEVGEHLPESAARGLVAGLCGARYVFFGAAVPGQGGVDHINERWQGYWARLFAEHDYYGDCQVRNEFWDDRRVAVYYRQNVAIYESATDERVTPRGLAVRMAAMMREKKVPDVVHPDMWAVRLGLPLP